MQSTTMQPNAAQIGNLDDPSYQAFLQRVRDRFASNAATAPLFTTDAEDLWDVYLQSFPEGARQFHNCNACRRFVERYGSLVTIEDRGMILPAVWLPDDADIDHRHAVSAMANRLCRATVTGVFLSSDETWGQPITGAWCHLHAYSPKGHVFKKLTLTAGQAMAEKLEDFKNVQRALSEFTPAMLAQALSLLNADALYRSEKVIGPAKWLADLHAAIETNKGRRANLVWRAVATAPAGLCHPRSSMIGTLLEDLAAGLAFEEVSRKFAAKMHPLQYQRPQAAPTAGNIAQAEKVIAQLNAAGSLERRYARVEEIDALWRPAPPEPSKGGVFGHLKPKGATTPTPMNVPAQSITFEKFRRTVLDGAKAIELLVPHQGNFVALVTAANPDAPPILQWDTEERRNPFSWYLYNGGSAASSWGLSGNAWAAVTAVALRPPKWFGGKSSHHGDGAIFVLNGARDSRWQVAGAGIFPEILKSEFHGIRQTIEAFSRGAKIAGYEESTACGFGIEANVRARVRVTDGVGTRIEYDIDRWD